MLNRMRSSLLHMLIAVGMFCGVYAIEASTTSDAAPESVLSLKGGSTSSIPASANCTAYNGYAGQCVGQRDGTECTRCSSNATYSYLILGLIDPPGFMYGEIVGPPPVCGNVSVGGCVSQVCLPTLAIDDEFCDAPDTITLQH